MGDLLQLLVHDYNLHVDPSLVMLVTSGRHEIYRITTKHGDLIAKLGRGSDGIAAVTREAVAFSCLASISGPVPRVLSSANGQAYALYPDQRCAVLVREAIPGQPIAETEDGYARYGAALAQLHIAMDQVAKCERGLSFQEFDPSHAVAKAAEIICRGTDGTTYVDQLAPLCDFVTRRLKETQCLWSQGALCHGDAHFCNVLFVDPDDGCWIDFEDVYLGPRTYDIATLVWSTLRCQKTRPLWEAGLKGYARIAEVTSDHLKCLGLFVAVRHIWWLGLHAAAWGQYAMHSNRRRFFGEGIRLLEIICCDACGM